MSVIGATQELANDQEENKNIPLMVSSGTECVTRRERVNIGRNRIMTLIVVVEDANAMSSRLKDKI